MSITFSDEQSQTVDGDALVALARRVIADEGYPDSTEVSIRTVSDDAIAELKRTWFSVDAPTDVLSFPIDELTPGEVPESDPDGPPVLLGDIVLAPGFIRRQADEMGVPERDEMSLMVVHGMLHLMGWDHETDEEAERMEAREREILATVGVERR